MQAAVITPFGQPWVPQERPIAAPGAGQILVKTQACGVYRTDLHAPACPLRQLKPTPPLVSGQQGRWHCRGCTQPVGIVSTARRRGKPCGSRAKFGRHT